MAQTKNDELLAENEELKKELRALKAEKEQALKEKAEKEEAERLEAERIKAEMEARKNSKVVLTIQPSEDHKRGEAVFVGINGNSYGIPVGIPVTVPYPVYAAYKCSEKQDTYTAQLIDELENMSASR